MTNEHPAEQAAGHEAQRELEHKALRNVRGLVDRMEADEQAKRNSQKWIVAGLAAIAVVLFGAILAMTSWRKSAEVREISLPPASKAPAR